MGDRTIIATGKFYMDGQFVGECGLLEIPTVEQSVAMTEQLSRDFGLPVGFEVELPLNPVNPNDLEIWQRGICKQIIQDVLVDIEQRKPPFWAKTWKGARHESARPGRYFRR